MILLQLNLNIILTGMRRSFPLIPARSASLIPKPLPLPKLDPAQFHPSVPLQAAAKEWKPGCKRVGAVGVKIGMTAIWDVSGERHPVTVVQLQNTQVIQVGTKESEGSSSLQVGTGRKSGKRTRKSQLNHFGKYGVQPKRYVREFQVSDDALLPPGFEIRAEHFVPGQYVDIQGVSIGKGFQGAMKRWGFRGLEASHGVSVSHRSLGSTGNRQDPGRVWRGKKMAGRMGTDRITVLNLRILKIDTVLNLLYVRGPVPGHRNGFVKIRDSNYKPFPSPPPYPSYIRGKDEVLPRELVAPEFVPRALVHVKNNWQAGSGSGSESDLDLDKAAAGGQQSGGKKEAAGKGKGKEKEKAPAKKEQKKK